MNRNKKWILAVIPFAAVLITTTSYGQPYYKWVDDKGATHYTQTPPPQKAAQKVTVSTHTPEDSANEIKNLNDQASKNLKATTEEEAAASKTKLNAAADTERRNKNSATCQHVKANQALLQTGQRIHTFDAKGERSYLTEEQKSAQIKQQATQIKNDCPQ